MEPACAGIPVGVVAALMEFSLDAVVTKTRQGMVTGWSPAAVRLYGYQPSQIIGRDASILMPAGWESEEAELLRRAAAGDRVAPYSTHRVHQDGTVITVRLAMSPIVDESGTVVGAASISQPLAAPHSPSGEAPVPQEDRERLQAQLEQAQRLEGLGQLAGGVAHDFNNLIAVILNYATFIGEEIETAAHASDAQRWKGTADDIGKIRSAAERAAGLTRQLLSFARREVAQPRVVNLNTLLHDMVQLLRRVLGADLQLVTHLSDNLPPVLIDPGQFDQTILNLAVNARDAMPDGGTLTITTDALQIDREQAAEWSSLLPGRYVRLQVADTGKGMTPEVQQHIFEPFFTTKSRGTGTGLGLATVYGAITQAEGHIQVHSQPEHGTTFAILLPVTTQAAETDAPDTPPSHKSRGETVLIVEDEDALREVIRRLLARQGYQVLTAANGAEAVTTAGSYQGLIHLLLTDVIMPQMLGKDAAQQIKQDRPNVRVLYMSGYAQPLLTSQGRLDPNVRLLDKPFTEQQLLAKVSAVLNEPATPFAGQPAPLSTRSQT